MALVLLDRALCMANALMAEYRPPNALLVIVSHLQGNCTSGQQANQSWGLSMAMYT